MRKFATRLFGTAKLICAFLLLFSLGLFLASPAFEGEGYTFYQKANSSSLQISSNRPFFDKLFLHAEGESASFEGNLYETLKEKYRAKLLFCEELDEATCYYLYSPCFSRGVELNGKFVNLEIAVGKARTVAGTPLIFGGF